MEDPRLMISFVVVGGKAHMVDVLEIMHHTAYLVGLGINED